MQSFTLRFAGPMMALQGPRIDGRSQALPIPTRSMITGLIGAALGIGRDQSNVLQSIQDTMTMAAVVHRHGQIETDYQTADLSKPFMRGPMWTSGTSVFHRAGGDIEGTRQQWRPYTCDADITVIVELLEGAPFSAEEILDALDEPKRVLALGRMSCPPTTRIAGEVLDVDKLDDAATEMDGDIYLPAEEMEPKWGDLLVSIPGTRQWSSRLHAGTDTYVRRVVGSK